MKTLIIVMIMSFQCLLSANDKIDIELTYFADRLSKQNNINIYIDEDIKQKKVSMLIPDKISNIDLLNLFKKSVSKMDYNFNKVGQTYYLTKKIPYIDRVYMYELKYNSSKDCSKMLTSLGVKHSYLADSNTYIITSNSKRYPKIKEHLEKIDKIQKQVMLKIMIFEFSDTDIKERGVQYASIYKGVDNTIQYALNTIVAPINTNNPTLKSIDFYGAIRLLNEEKMLNVKQYPYVLAKNNKSFKFEAVENIPYLVTTTKTEASNTSEQNSIEYKDVGLKINGVSLIYKDYITLDLNLVIEDLISSNEETVMPQTYKRVLQSNTNINYNKVLLLSGIKRTKHIKNDWNIPYISNIPYLGELFKYSTKDEQQINITIAIEVIKSEEFDHTIEVDTAEEFYQFCEAQAEQND